MGVHSRAAECSGCEGQKLCQSLCVTPGLQAQRVVDAGVEPSGEAAAGSPINWKRKLKAERESQDEGPVVALRINQSLESLGVVQKRM